MSIESLVTLKDRYDNNGRPNFGNQVLNILVDEILALDGRNEVLDAKVDELDSKIDALEVRVETLEGV